MYLRWDLQVNTEFINVSYPCPEFYTVAFCELRFSYNQKQSCKYLTHPCGQLWIGITSLLTFFSTSFVYLPFFWQFLSSSDCPGTISYCFLHSHISELVLLVVHQTFPCSMMSSEEPWTCGSTLMFKIVWIWDFQSGILSLYYTTQWEKT